MMKSDGGCYGYGTNAKARPHRTPHQGNWRDHHWRRGSCPLSRDVELDTQQHTARIVVVVAGYWAHVSFERLLPEKIRARTEVGHGAPQTRSLKAKTGQHRPVGYCDPAANCQPRAWPI